MYSTRSIQQNKMLLHTTKTENINIVHTLKISQIKIFREQKGLNHKIIKHLHLHFPFTQKCVIFDVNAGNLIGFRDSFCYFRIVHKEFQQNGF
jgi:hypothetical protein